MIHVRKDQIHPRKQLHPCEAIFTSLLLRPGVFACRKTLLSGVQIVKDQLDVDGLYVLQDGKSTVCARLTTGQRETPWLHQTLLKSKSLVSARVSSTPLKQALLSMW